MQQEVFEPKNKLEEMLIAAMGGELSSEDFMRAMMAEQVFIPVRDEPDSGIKGFQRTTKATPLVIQDEDGLNILVMFTNPERARSFLDEMPGFSGGLLVEFSWILERVDAGFAITVNPGLDAGIDIEPEIVTQMLELLAAEAPKN
ncbi:MAG: SseB family protein [Gammaproteobacteria bacterium]|nr:SseB family protein [Gammaproteobacteria bacterium]MBU1646647.1 SseB family protein [Gammaproteobacteria bacterium]MBU1972904.1 SseB family protein [Gammaproteobacteria bacterium]